MENTEIITKKPDRRVIKTKRAICNAFALLLSKKEINDITIKEVAELADVNRKTVYNYYGGIHEILDEIENEVVKSYTTAIRTYNLKDEIRNPIKIFDNLTKVLSSDIEFYGSLFKLNNNSQLAIKIISSLKEKTVNEIANLHIFPEDKLPYLISYVISGMIAAYQTWFNSDRHMALEDFSREMGVLVLKGIDVFKLTY